MTLFKVVEKVDFSSKAWKDFILWRNYNFSVFDSLDTSIRESLFSVSSEEDWDNSVTHGDILTNMISDEGYAIKVAKKFQNYEILSFDYLENKNDKKIIIGYDILDGAGTYSLLCNFGNDISIVNNVLAKNALIRHERQAIDVFKWFQREMPNDGHVLGSRIYAVYEKIKIV